MSVQRQAEQLESLDGGPSREGAVPDDARLTHAEWLALGRAVEVDPQMAGDAAQTVGHELSVTAPEATGPGGIAGYDDAAFRATILRALRLLAVICAVAAPIVWWRMGWQSAAMLLVGAAISGSGLREWLKLMTAVMVRMDHAAAAQDSGGAGAAAVSSQGVKSRPIGGVLVGFFVRLGVTLAVLYGSLKLLDGSVYALAAGLGLGVFALFVEGIRLVRAWSM